MNILQVTPRYPPHTGGVETHVKEISERLVGRGHEVTVVTADAGEDVRDREIRNGVVVRRHRGLSPGGAFHVAPGIGLTVHNSKADIVHAHNYHSLPLLFASLGKSGQRFVVTPHYHGGSASSYRDRLLTLYRPIGERGLRRGDVVIAVSDWEREQLKRDFDVEAEVIPNGLDVEQFANATPERRDRPYLLCVGRLEEYKGIQYAIRALPVLSEYELVVAGSGAYRNQLERAARDEGVENRVSFLGYVSDDRLPGLYAGADVHLVLSSFEAYGMTVAEALASGTPCVVRTAGALTDWVDRDDCLGVADVDPREIAAAVRSARTVAAPSDELLSWEEVTTRLLDQYG
jgi:glycosyltransferase involved in cell wall biosynthesis